MAPKKGRHDSLDNSECLVSSNTRARSRRKISTPSCSEDRVDCLQAEDDTRQLDNGSKQMQQSA